MKVIAVIDKPKSCASCPFINDGYAFGECRLSRRIMTSAESSSVPEWCELRPLPKKENETEPEFSEIQDYLFGWNDCLDAIVGEEE